MMDVLAGLVGAPVTLEELKHKPGRRWTLRSHGSDRTAIVKVYGSQRAAVVARRVAALGDGPPEPIVPTVLHVDPELHLVVLSDVPGRPLREAVLEGDLATCARVGAALGAWHAAWQGRTPEPLQPHTARSEIDILRARCETASPAVAGAIEGWLAQRTREWACDTVVHRDLYEEQILVGERIGLIDLDDAALGPPELDIGNLLAHVHLLASRLGIDLAPTMHALRDGYAETGPMLDQALLERCRALTLLRLACLNDDVRLSEAATSQGAMV